MAATHATHGVHRDDTLLPETRWASWAIVAVLVPAVVVLWGLPARTAEHWAWTIDTEMTAIFMGSGYAAGAYFFTRTASGRSWTAAAPGVLSAAIFAALMLIPTAIHWDRFNQGDAPFLGTVAFYGWVVVYVAAPVLVALLWLRNQRADRGRAEANDVVVAPGARRFALFVGTVALVASAVFLVSPETMIDAWPWALTPLTARVLACFTAQVGIGALLLSVEERWASWRLLAQTFLVATALLIVGTLRAWSDFDQDTASTWIFLGALIGMALAILLLYLRMERPARTR